MKSEIEGSCTLSAPEMSPLEIFPTQDDPQSGLIKRPAPAKARVKALRKRTGKSQSKFAQYFNIPVRTLQTWEAGGTCPPAYVLGMMERILELESKILEGRGE